MKKAVLISIQPKWCELIANSKKTVEVRKTRPKLDTPFKCYIYCTLSGSNEFFKEDCNGDIAEWNKNKMALKKGKVIGEFVCDEIIVAELGHYCNISCEEAQLDIFDLMDYADEKTVYGWRISNLVIYDKPKELSEFKKINQPCWYGEMGISKRDCPKCKNKECFIQRPPQSWCYVEELSE